MVLGAILHGPLPRLVVWLGRALVGLGCGALLGWMALAIYFDFSLLGPPWLRAWVAVLIPGAAAITLWFVRLRTNFRGEDVHLYRLDVPSANARAVLLRYLQEINQLRTRPQWYNALTDNCTTAIQRLARTSERRSWWSWKLFLNGYLDELAYDIGAIDRFLPFPVLRAKSYINERAKAANDDPRFSVRIREGLPQISIDRGSAGGTR